MMKPAAVPAPPSTALSFGARASRPELAAHDERTARAALHEQDQARRVLVVLLIMTAFFGAFGLIMLGFGFVRLTAERYPNPDK